MVSDQVPTERAADTAWNVAVSKRDWYARAAPRTHAANIASQVLLLLVGAATTISASVDAAVWVTAPLAGLSFVLTGARSVFNWNRLSVGRSIALRELQAATSRYEIVPSAQRTEQRQRELLDEVFAIIADEQGSWARSRRVDPSGSGVVPRSSVPAGA